MIALTVNENFRGTAHIHVAPRLAFQKAQLPAEEGNWSNPKASIPLRQACSRQTPHVHWHSIGCCRHRHRDASSHTSGTLSPRTPPAPQISPHVLIDCCETGSGAAWPVASPLLHTSSSWPLTLTVCAAALRRRKKKDEKKKEEKNQSAPFSADSITSSLPLPCTLGTYFLISRRWNSGAVFFLCLGPPSPFLFAFPGFNLFPLN